ncbi:MAG: two-component system, LuxR family, sensor kinase FixL [Gammaproteobacteria bacterium]|jgi:PAS domain S-box-containing protein|nr:two-component system, LuxR family, sensor kinase FixL [Gammaproteobacteria bacterium]
MPWVEQFSDTQELRRYIRDLMALSALPALWKDFDPPQIAGSVAAALITMLGSDFIHVALPGSHAEPDIEITHVGNGLKEDAAEILQSALRKALPQRATEQTLSIPNPVGTGTIRLAIAPIGFGGDAIVVAGAGRHDFPSEAQRLLLGIGANDATIALRRWRVEVEARRFSALIERSSDFVGFASMDGQSQYLNPAGLSLVGLDSVEAAARLNVFDFIAPNDRLRARDETLPVVLQTGRWVGEIEFRHFKTGVAIPLLVDWFRIDHPRTGQPMNMATVARDLRSQKDAEAELRRLNESLERHVSERTNELAQANDRLVAEMAERERTDARLQQAQLELWHATRLTAAGHLAGALAHELNQPLAAIANSVHAARLLLASGTKEKMAKVPEILNEAAGQALRGGQVIRRLREFVTRGETEKRIETIKPLIEEACALALTGSNALGVDVQFHFEPKAVSAFANRIQIQQVIVNIIHNALEAMVGTPRREIRLRTALPDTEFLEISIADSGPGIAKDIAEHLFEPFVSGKRTGMGLGLSISRSIIEAHGGKLRAQSNPGGGAIFRFTLATSSDGANSAD